MSRKESDNEGFFHGIIYYSNNSKSIYVTKGAREDGYNFISAQVRRLLGSCTHLKYIYLQFQLYFWTNLSSLPLQTSYALLSPLGSHFASNSDLNIHKISFLAFRTYRDYCNLCRSIVFKYFEVTFKFSALNNESFFFTKFDKIIPCINITNGCRQNYINSGLLCLHVCK